MSWVKSPLSFPNIVSIVYSGEELIRRDPSLLQKKSIVNMDPNQKSKSVTYLVVHTIFFIIMNRNRYDIDNKKPQ